MAKHLAGLASILILVALLGSATWAFFPKGEGIPNGDFMVGVTAFSIGVITFFGVATLNSPKKYEQILGGEHLRTAIACSLVMSYLFIASFTTFVANATVVGEVTKTFVTSFSNVIGITIAFYFGASAAAQIFSKPKDDRPSEDGKEKE